MNKNQGFTLIELMIVIAIIAIIAAIAIPGLLSSQRASNERNASASLKTLASAEADFRSNDRDGNKVTDFWTGDVAGLYTICPVGSIDPIKLVELSVAVADSNQGAAGNALAATPTADQETNIDHFGIVQTKAGYWYLALVNDEDATAYAQDTNSPQGISGAHNFSKFGFWAFPESRSAGRSVYLINEGNTILKRSTADTYAGPFGPSGTATGPTTAMLAGSTAAGDFPDDAELKADFSNMD